MWYSGAYCCLSIVLFAIVSGGEILQSQPDRGVRSLDGLPQNLAVLSGTTATLTCEASTDVGVRIMWLEYAFDPATPRLISDGIAVTPGHPEAARYSILQTRPTQFDLVINPTVLADGGRYICMDAQDGPPNVYRGNAELVIIGGPTNCSTTVPEGNAVFEGQEYSSECTVFYHGNIAPTLSWTGPDPYQVALGTNPDFVWSGVLFTADRTMDQRNFVSKTNFSDPLSVPPPADFATNSPDYTFLNTFPPLSVFWTPKAMYIMPVKNSYVVGDVITCYADAFPPAFFQWRNLRTGDVTSGSQITVDVTYVGFNSTMQCTAQNLIQGGIYTQNLFVFVNVPAPTTPPPTTTTPTTTPPLPQSSCDDLTGLWQSESPLATACIEVNLTTGYIWGLARNASDPYFVEFYGMSVADDFTYAGFSGIWPSNFVFGFAGECHKCFGVEYLTMNSMNRAKTNSPGCGVGSIPNTTPQFTFLRTGPPCRGSELNVWKPTEITKKMGVTVSKGVEQRPI